MKIFIINDTFFFTKNETSFIFDEEKIKKVAESIKKHLNGEAFTIWTSSDVQTSKVANFLRESLKPFKKYRFSFLKFPQLYSGKRRNRENFEKFEWLKLSLMSFKDDNVIIVAGPEYAAEYPVEELGLPKIQSEEIPGVLIKDAKCILLPD